MIEPCHLSCRLLLPPLQAAAWCLFRGTWSRSLLVPKSRSARRQEQTPVLCPRKKKSSGRTNFTPQPLKSLEAAQESTSSSDESPPKLLILLCWSLALSRSRSQHTCVCALLLGLARRPWQEVTRACASWSHSSFWAGGSTEGSGGEGGGWVLVALLFEAEAACPACLHVGLGCPRGSSPRRRCSPEHFCKQPGGIRGQTWL